MYVQVKLREISITELCKISAYAPEWNTLASMREFKGNSCALKHCISTFHGRKLGLRETANLSSPHRQKAVLEPTLQYQKRM